MSAYRLEFTARWADLDPNRHLRHTAYNDYATHVRFCYLESRGFGVARFEEAGLGPVILHEESRFLAEIGMGGRFTVDFRLLGASPRLSRFRLRHDFVREDGRQAAVVTVAGGWLNLVERRLVDAPAELASALLDLPRADGFERLEDRGS